MGFLISSGSVVVSVTRDSFGRFANPLATSHGLTRFAKCGGYKRAGRNG